MSSLDEFAAENEIPVYRHAGPTIARFHASDAIVRLLMGPIGSGKTSGALTELWIRACRQKPNAKGVRYTRWAAIRDTYPNLKKLIDSWEEQPISRLAKVQGGVNKPGSWHVRQRLADGTTVDCEILFVALGSMNVEQFMRGLQVTGMLLEEGDTLPPDIIAHAIGRLGRFPNSREHGFVTWKGLWVVYNAPDMDNWLYHRVEVEGLPESWEAFKQPGGLEPGAENIDLGLKALGGRAYYTQAMDGQPTWWVRRMVENKYGYSRAGKPVYPDFDQDRHVSPVNLKPLDGVEITAGLDQGRTMPAAIFLQRDPADGQIRVLAELIAEDVNARQFAQLVRRFIDREYRWFSFRFVADPAALHRSSTDDDDASWLDIVSRALGERVRAARTNAIATRVAAVETAMTRPLREGRFGLLVDPRCKMLIQGFAHGYHYRALASAHGMPFDQKPDKNKYSNPHDALQYGVMEVSDVVELGLKRRRGGEPARPAAPYHPLEHLRRA